MRIKELPTNDRKDAKELFYGRYMAGYCVAWAIAASRKLRSHDLVGIWRGTELMHAATRVEPNFFDVRGIIGMAELLHGWGGCALRPTNEKELREDDPKISDVDIDIANFHIELMYPELCDDMNSDCQSPRREKLEDFVTALESLCKKHGVHLRSDLPRGKTIVMYESHGYEEGFEISFSATGAAFLDRILKP